MARKTEFPHLHVVLLCEDYGSRLWPIAREQDPACAAPESPGSKQSLLSATVERFFPYTSEKISVVTTAKLADVVGNLLSGNCGLSDDDYELLVQPTYRGTAFAVALACARIRKSDPQAVVLVSRTDQRVAVDERWERVLFDAYQVATQDRIAVIGGIQETKCAEWTYIRKGKPFPGVNDTHHVRLFNAEQAPGAAKRACNQGAYWHTGIIVSGAGLIMGEMSRIGNQGITPESDSSHRIVEVANFMAQLELEDWLRIAAKEVIASLPIVSIEKALLEASKRLVLVPTRIRFDALTSLEDLDSMAEPARDGNRVIGEAALTRCKDTTVYSQGTRRKVVTLGIRNTLVIELDDMTLVVSKDQIENLGDILSDLVKNGGTQL